MEKRTDLFTYLFFFLLQLEIVHAIIVQQIFFQLIPDPTQAHSKSTLISFCKTIQILHVLKLDMQPIHRLVVKIVSLIKPAANIFGI